MTNHYVATVPVKFTDTDGQERTRFQRVGAMFRNTRNGDGSEFFSLKLDFPVPVPAMPGPAVGSPEATSRSRRSLRDQRMIADRKGQAATDRPVSLKGAIRKNLSARASRFLRQRFGGAKSGPP